MQMLLILGQLSSCSSYLSTKRRGGNIDRLSSAAHRDIKIDRATMLETKMEDITRA